MMKKEGMMSPAALAEICDKLNEKCAQEPMLNYLNRINASVNRLEKNREGYLLTSFQYLPNSSTRIIDAVTKMSPVVSRVSQRRFSGETFVTRIGFDNSFLEELLSNFDVLMPLILEEVIQGLLVKLGANSAKELYGEFLIAPVPGHGTSLFSFYGDDDLQEIEMIIRTDCFLPKTGGVIL